MPTTEDLVADYVRTSMRVEMPASLSAEVMQFAALTPQDARPRFNAFAPFVPALAAVAATALVIAVGLLVATPRQVGPEPAVDASSGPPTPTPRPTITPEDARALTEPGDVVVLPALDGGGEFGTVTIRRGEERAGYEDFVPFAFGDVFFIELHVRYEPERFTPEQYGEWEFAYAADLDDDGSVADEVPQRGVGFVGMEGMPGFESGPQPVLYGMSSGVDVLEGWLVLEIPASAADHDIYLLYGHGEWEGGIQNLEPDAAALLRHAAEPVGVTPFDPDAFPTPDPSASPFVLPDRLGLPSPAPSPAATFDPVADPEADRLFAETQNCRNAELGVTITYPATWYTGEVEDPMGNVLPACTVFSPEPIDEQIFLFPPDAQPRVMFSEITEWLGGVEEPIVERFPLGDRMTWRLSFAPDQMSFGMNYLIQSSEDPYGPFMVVGTSHPELRAAIERMLVRLEFEE